MVTIEVRGMERRFPDGTTIGPIDLRIEDGECVCLLGPSGSGKTTTLRMIAGFIQPDRGRLLFDGKDVTRLPPKDREIGMVAQSTALFPNMSVFQNISFGPEVEGWDHKRTVARVEELAELLSITPLLHRRIKEISGGEAQRVAIARALARHPNLLLLDEPLSALDPGLKERLQTEIRKIQQEVGISTVYVTHSQAEAFAVSDRIAVLNHGSTVQFDTPENLYKSPKNEFVATFIGNGSVLDGNAVECSDGSAIVLIGNQELQVRGHCREGDRVRVAFKPEHIIISKDPIGSAQRGLVVSCVPDVGSVKIVVESDGQRLVTEIQDLELTKSVTLGDTVYAQLRSQTGWILASETATPTAPD